MISNYLKRPHHLEYQIFESPCTSQMTSNFLKHPVHLKWYQIFWNTLYISKDIEFFEHPVRLKWFQIFWNTLYISNDIKYFETPCTSQMISNFFKSCSVIIFEFRLTVKEFQVLLINTNNSIQHYSFTGTYLNNGFLYYYESQTIQSNINHLFNIK